MFLRVRVSDGVDADKPALESSHHGNYIDETHAQVLNAKRADTRKCDSVLIKF